MWEREAGRIEKINCIHSCLSAHSVCCEHIIRWNDVSEKEIKFRRGSHHCCTIRIAHTTPHFKDYFVATATWQDIHIISSHFFRHCYSSSFQKFMRCMRALRSRCSQNMNINTYQQRRRQNEIISSLLGDAWRTNCALLNAHAAAILCTHDKRIAFYARNIFSNKSKELLCTFILSLITEIGETNHIINKRTVRTRTLQTTMTPDIFVLLLWLVSLDEKRRQSDLQADGRTSAWTESYIFVVIIFIAFEHSSVYQPRRVEYQNQSQNVTTRPHLARMQCLWNVNIMVTLTVAIISQPLHAHTHYH